MRHAFVTAENAAALLAELAAPAEFDLLSLDIDRNTYHLWRALGSYRPRVWCSRGVLSSVSSIAGGVAENVGGSDMRTLLRLCGLVPVLESVDFETSLPPGLGETDVCGDFGGTGGDFGSGSGSRAGLGVRSSSTASTAAA